KKSDGIEAINFWYIVTTEQYKAFDLAFDFNLSEGANSGVKYFVTLSEGNTGSAIGLEYQILDDALHPDAKMGRDGNRTLASLYDLIKAEKQARFVRKPGEWNQGRVVVYPDNKVEHYLNGVKVLEYQRGSQAYRDLVAISKYAVWNKFGEAEQGRILLQDHGDAVQYKNIKIKPLQ
ncbi:MAG: 3-keto-disaccharide hydrolase, partial [Algoriphagus sp.]